MPFQATTTIKGRHEETTLKKLNDNCLPVGSTFEIPHATFTDISPILQNDFSVVTKTGDRMYLALMILTDDFECTTQFKAFTNVIYRLFKINPTEYMNLSMSAKQNLYDESMKIIVGKKVRITGKVSSYLGRSELHMTSFEFE